MRTKIPIALCVMLMALGCSAAKTTFMHVDESGNLCPSPDKPVKGVPALVKVPTHIEVEIIETVYWNSDEKDLTPIKESTCRRAEVKEVCTNRLVFLDPKRPVSGVGSFNVGLSTTDQTLANVNYHAKDETIKNSATLAANVAKLFAKTGGANEQGTSSKTVSAERTVAFRRFPIQCDRSEIDAFLTEHINCCANGCSDSPKYAK